MLTYLVFISWVGTFTVEIMCFPLCSFKQDDIKLIISFYHLNNYDIFYNLYFSIWMLEYQLVYTFELGLYVNLSFGWKVLWPIRWMKKNVFLIFVRVTLSNFELGWFVYLTFGWKVLWPIKWMKKMGPTCVSYIIFSQILHLVNHIFIICAYMVNVNLGSGCSWF